jgi:ubiquinone/menaquinone biosynthesis C-methylase UbiE
MGERAPVPKPIVPADLYDDDYFRACCAGSEEWSASGGADAAPMYEWYLRRAGLRAGESVVDIGAGRGELVAVAARLGAARAVGVEYSAAATKLARKTAVAHGVADRALVARGDARAAPLRDGSADLVTFLDIVEHLGPVELDAAFAEARRILRPGGRVLVHTMPNRAIYDVTYKVLRSLVPRARRTWPADPRNDYEHRMHVNEQTVSSLRRVIKRAGFAHVRVSTGAWVYTDFVPAERARALYRRLAANRLTSRVAAADIWADATKAAL